MLPVGPPDASTPDEVLTVARLMRETPQLVVSAHGAGATDLHPVRQLAHAARLALLSCPAAGQDDARLRAAARAAQLNGALLHVPIAPSPAEAPAPATNFAAVLARFTGPVVLTTPGRAPAIDVAPRTGVAFAIPLPDLAQRAAFWIALLQDRPVMNGQEPQALARTLAERYRLGYAAMERAVAEADTMAQLRAPRNRKIEPQDLAACCRRLSAPGPIELARRMRPDQMAIDLDDLVLPVATRRRLDDLAQRLGQRRRVFAASGLAARIPLGHGTVVLFTGPSGTGKTVAALLVAKRLGFDLLKADLGSLVSKYVGETEQRLDRLFAAAEAADAVLFFDEADALFGRRGEVKEARDRWANLETNYLLQRIEEFDGIVVLSTNLRQNIDEAFMRRIDVAINFPMPDAALRRRLWRSLLPPAVEAPPDVELDRLADALTLSGGHIKNIMVDAAHRAYAAHDGAGERPRLTAHHLVEAAAATFEKLGRPVGPGEFTSEWLSWLREREGAR
jgi:hypothetical protein